MSKFEDHLWREFVREHGNALAQMSTPTAKRRRPRARLVVGTSLGLAGVGAAVAIVLGAASTSPAFAVTRNHDGTVTISIERASGIAGANARLHQLGIKASVMPRAPLNCTPTISHPPGTQSTSAPSQDTREIANAHWTINPRQIPKDSTLALTPPPTPPDQNSGNGRLGRPVLGMRNGRSGTRHQPSPQSPVRQQR